MIQQNEQKLIFYNTWDVYKTKVPYNKYSFNNNNFKTVEDMWDDCEKTPRKKDLFFVEFEI